MEIVAVSNIGRSVEVADRQIDGESADVLDMWMQPRLSHQSGPPPCESAKQTLESVDMPAAHSAAARAGTRDGTKLKVRVATPQHWSWLVSTIGPRQQFGGRARSRGRYLAGGRSGLSAHFRAAKSRSGSSSQTRQM